MHQSRSNTELFQQIQPEDLIRYGLIPEFVGRLPVVGTLHELDEAAMIEILTQPKNALARQYQKQFEWDGIKLRFTDEALRAVARQACERKVGARGLRMILEELMLDAMYTLPSQKKMKELVVTAEMVVNRRVVFPLEKAG
jgi:ATP-dependent Clp protease ATP-binding subunit ClpX